MPSFLIGENIAVARSAAVVCEAEIAQAKLALRSFQAGDLESSFRLSLSYTI